MGLTFQQQFYHVPEKVFLVTLPNGMPKAIIEMPEDCDESLLLQSNIWMKNLRVFPLDFDKLIRNGYEIKKQMSE